MRIATFNILSGRAPGESAVDPVRFGEAVAALDADLLALQEVDLAQPRSGHADLTDLAARAMGAREQRFVPALTGTPGQSWSPAVGDDPTPGPAYGIALLSRYPVTRWQVLRLVGLPTRVPHRWPGTTRPALVRDEPRVAVLAQVESPVGPLRVAATHLSFLRWWNGHQLRSLLRRVPGGPPDLLLGDLNMRPARAARLTGMRALATGPTFEAPAPTEQIDHVLTSDGGLVATAGRSVPLPVSDHRALVVEISR